MIAGDVNSRPVTGNELVFTVEKFLLQTAVKCVEKVSESIASKLAALLVKSGFRWCICSAAKITIKFLFDTISLHGEEHHKYVMEPHLSVPSEVLAGVNDILSRVGGDLVDCRKQQGFNNIRNFHNMP